MHTLPITRLIGTAQIGRYTVNLEGRAVAPEFGSVIWYRQYIHHPQTGEWGPFGRPAKLVFLGFHSRDERDDKWECRDFRGANRSLGGVVIYIGSKSVCRIEATRFSIFPVIYRWRDRAGRKRRGNTVVTALSRDAAETIFRRAHPQCCDVTVLQPAA
jgi:hypothetical protein